MDITETLIVTTVEEWRQWFEKNYQSSKEIWLIIPHKASGKPGIPYNEAVEVALCYGWIDSILKKFDEHSAAQRFSPRKPKSTYSQSNIERLKRLTHAGMLKPEVKKTVRALLEQQ